MFYLRLVSVFVSDVGDRDYLTLRGGPRERSLGYIRHNWGVSSEVAGSSLFLGCNAVVSFEANKNIVKMLILL